MDGVYHGLETSLLAFALALSLGAFALFADPPAPAFPVTLPTLVVDVPPAGR